MLMRKLLAALAAVTTVCLAAPAEKARTTLDSGLADKNPDTRKQAVLALSLAVPRPPFLEMLEKAIDDKDVEVRLAAVASLLDLKGPHTISLLHKALDDDVPEVAFAAAKALYALHDPKGREALFAVLAGETKTTSGFLTQKKREALRMMHTPHAMVVLAVSQGVGMVPLPGFGTGVSSLQGLLSDSGTSGRAAAALLLGREKDAATLAALKEALDDKDWSVRAAAVHSLALRNDPRVLSAIEPLLDDKKEAVRLRAATACLRLELLGKPRRPAVKKKSGA